MPARFLDLVRAVVAAAADRRGPGAAGRVGAGHAAADSGAAQRQLYWDSDPAGDSGRFAQRRTTTLGPTFGDWIGDNDFFNFFGMPEHDCDQPVDTQTIPANASIEIRESARRREHYRGRPAELAGAGA